MEAVYLVLAISVSVWLLFRGKDRALMSENIAGTVVSTTGLAKDSVDFGRMSLQYAKLDAISSHAEAQQERMQNGMTIDTVKEVSKFDKELLKLYS